MAKHQLIISRDLHRAFPVRSEEGQFKVTRTLVINWNGSWEPRDQPEQCLMVAPGDELEVVLADEQREGGSLWIYKRMNSLPPLFVPLPEDKHGNGMERVDLEKGSVILTVNPALAKDAGEARYNLRISALGEVPAPFVGQGQAGTLIATKP